MAGAGGRSPAPLQAAMAGGCLLCFVKRQGRGGVFLVPQEQGYFALPGGGGFLLR